MSKLLDEVRAASARALDLAAIVVARTTVEVAIKLSLRKLHARESGKPHAREDRLFDEHLKTNDGFKPAGRSSTRATLSAVRELGNEAVHIGEVVDVCEQHALLLQLPRALASLSSAVDGALASSK